MQNSTQTAFISPIEWFMYYAVIPRHITFYHNRVTGQEYTDSIKNALNILEIVELRNQKTVPISYSATMELLRLPILTMESNLKSEDLNKLMLMSVIRVVNMLCDCGNNSKLGRSISKILQKLNLKEFGLVSEVRHAGTHKNLPSIEVTQTAVKALYHFLIEQYWDMQFESSAFFLRENFSKIQDFLGKYSQENPNLFKTNIKEWDDVNRILISKKGKHKERTSEKIVKQNQSSGKNRLKRAFKILDLLNKLIQTLKHAEIRFKYLESGFEKDIDHLKSFLRNTDRLLFQKYAFLQFKLTNIILYEELHESFSVVLNAIKSKIPSVVKDLEQSSKITSNYKVFQISENKEVEMTPTKVFTEANQKKIDDAWIPHPFGYNLVKQFSL